jgi:AcrR family transcriptional regulator
VITAPRTVDPGPPGRRRQQDGDPTTAGRPRPDTRRRRGASAREEILDAAAELISERGYAATSTRAIAEAVGIKQASLYYHFASKEQILTALLLGTLDPSLAVATALGRRPEPPEVKLWTLAASDVRLLCSARWNLGALYLLPELRTPALAPLARKRQRLRVAYRDLISAGRSGGSMTVTDPAVATDLVVGLVESVIGVRADRGRLDPREVAPTVADGCLRLVGTGGRRLAGVRRRGEALLTLLTEDPVVGSRADGLAGPSPTVARSTP